MVLFSHNYHFCKGTYRFVDINVAKCSSVVGYFIHPIPSLNQIGSLNSPAAVKALHYSSQGSLLQRIALSW